MPAQNPTATQRATAEADPAQGAVWDLTAIFPNDAAAESERAATI